MILRKTNLIFLLLLLSQPACAAKVFTLVNNVYHGRITLNFNQDYACLSSSLLREWGFLPAMKETASFDASGCLKKSELRRWEIKYFFDQDAQLVTLVVPSHLMSNKKNGIASSRWDDGIPALFTNYHLNYQRNSGRNYRYQTDKNDLYLKLDSGLNLAGWRLRVGHQYQQSAYGERGWLTQNVTLSRPVRSLRALLTVGDSTSPSNLFDNFSYRGVMFATDERMLPDGLRQFSPVIRGIAKSNAEVVLRQNGSVIYQTFVAPGPFVLRDVYPPGSEGDLEMTITESDGTETLRTMPYAAMPNLTHHNVINYQLLAGHYKRWEGTDYEQPSFMQGTLTYGLTERFSLFAGGMSSPIYQSWGGGTGLSMGQGGAVSVDYLSSRAKDPRRPEKDRGAVWRIRYAKAFLPAGTSLSLQARYFPGGQRFRNFQETIYQQQTYWWDWDDEGHYDGDFDPEKLTSFNAYLNQSIGENSNLYLTWQRDNFRKKNQHNSSLTFGADHSWNDIDYGLSLSWERDAGLPANGEITLDISIPMKIFSKNRSKLNVSRTFAHHGERSQQASVSGTALEDYSLSYSVGGQHSQTENDSVNASLGYQYNAGEMRIGVAQGGNFRQRNVDVTGSLMLHPYGLTLGQTLGDTMALVEVSHSPGIGVDNQFGFTTDRRGFALVSYLTPYRVNRLTLDNYTQAETLNLPDSEVDVVPTAGAVVFGRFRGAEPVEKSP